MGGGSGTAKGKIKLPIFNFTSAFVQIIVYYFHPHTNLFLLFT